MKKLGLPLGIIAVVGVMVAIFLVGNKSASKPQTSNDQQLLGTKYPELERTHISDGSKSPVTYNSNPPSSGPHWSQPAPWGIVDPAKVEADERYIHNMEHGGVWITYKPDMDPAQIQALKDAFNKLPTDGKYNEVKAVLTPRAANPHNIELVAWQYVYDMDQLDVAKLNQFYKDHVDKGPEDIP